MLNWLRNALGEAPPRLSRADIEDLERRFELLQLEWSDVLDKLMAREDRERKRMAKAVQLSAGGDPAQGTLPFPPAARGRRLIGGR